jgi:hypothetical protein
MATKRDLMKQAITAGVIPENADEDDYTAQQLEVLIDPSKAPAWEGSMSSSKPLVGPDGHVHLSQEDLDARQ